MKVLQNHQWLFPDEITTASRLFEILTFSELGLLRDFGIFNQSEIKIIGQTAEGETKTMRVKDMEIVPRSRALNLLCEDNGQEVNYFVNLDEAIAQFVEKFWDD
jgi:hypothetical protein